MRGEEAFRRDPGHPQWHHGAFQDVADLKSDIRNMLHSSSAAQVPFWVPLEVNIVLVGFNGDGGFRFSLDARKLEEFMKRSFPSYHPACLETALPLDIEHDLLYNVIPRGLCKSNDWILVVIKLCKYFLQQQNPTDGAVSSSTKVLTSMESNGWSVTSTSV